MGDGVVIIIDGYNVLKPKSKNEIVSERRRIFFIDQLAAYSKRSSNQVVIVFDGGGSPFIERLKQDGVAVIYSGFRDSADDVIKQLLYEQRIDDALLVSTDRDICNHAEALSIVSIDAHDFYSYLQDDHAELPGQVKKNTVHGVHKRPGHKSSSEVDDLMQLASSMMLPHSDRDADSYLDYADVERKKSVAKKLSKKEKQLQKIIKKL
jgi:predicted RNA-binding protein with PIN domain